MDDSAEPPDSELPGDDDVSPVEPSPARDLAPAAAGVPPEVAGLAAAAAEYADAAMASSTRRAYDSAWRGFSAWCDAHGAAALPAGAFTIAAYLTDRAPTTAVATLGRHLAAIAAAHRKADLPVPAGAKLDEIWAGIRRTHGRPPRQKRALVTKDLQGLVKRLPASTAGVRDKALLLICYAGAFRRSELAALVLDDGKSGYAPLRLRLVAGGAEIRLDRSKTDQTGEGRVVAIPRGKTRLCPIAALEAWLDLAGICNGPIFRSVDRHGRIGASAINDRTVALVVKRACARAKLDPALFAGHSLRAGFVTEAAAAGVQTELIMRQTGHRKAETVQTYIREAELFKRNAASSVGL